MKRIASLLIILIALNANSQLPPSPDSMMLINLNQRIDDLVVEGKINNLDSLYAEDFVFSHGSGRVEGKSGWLRTVGRNNYIIRRHDSVSVQQHGNIAVLRGMMYIERKGREKRPDAKYKLKYIRVFAMRTQRWQLISHTTTWESHLE